MSCLAVARTGIAAPKLRVEIIATEQAFLDLEPVWNQVVAAAEIDHPFLEFAWARTWWECFGKGSRLNILVLWDADEPIAIAPLISTTIRMWGTPVRRLGFLYNAHVPRADFIIAKRAKEAYREIWMYLSQARDWDLLQLCQLPETSPTLEAVDNLAKHDGNPTGTWISGSSPYVRLNTSWSEYSQSLPAKHRSNLRNRFKRLTQVGPVELEVCGADRLVRPGPPGPALDLAGQAGQATGCGPGGPPHLENALEDGFRLEASAWKGEEGTAIACASELRQFYSQFAKRAAEQGWLRLNFLRSGDKRVAFDYSLVYKNQVFLLKLGYDPEFSPYSPSNLLLSMAIENAFQQGRYRYDFLGEFAEWKRSWAKEGLTHQWLFVFSKGLKGRLLHALKFRLIPLAKLMKQKVGRTT